MAMQEDIEAAIKRGEHAYRMAEQVIRLKPVRLIPDHPENAPEYLADQGLSLDDHCAVLGEWGNTKHFLILNVSKNWILPGIFHLDRFEEIPEDDL